MSLVPFGCSHMASISNAISKRDSTTPNNTTFIGGNSNHKMIEDIYRFSNRYPLEPKFFGEHILKDDFIRLNPKNCVIYFQSTYTNRLWLPNILNSHTSSFHTMLPNSSQITLDNKIFEEELIDFYQKYVKFFWNYHLNLLDLLQKIDMLQTYIKSKEIKFIHTFWTFGSHSAEWEQVMNDVFKNSDFDFTKVKEQIQDILKKIEYEKPAGYDTITGWVQSFTKELTPAEKYVDSSHYKPWIYEKIYDDIIYPKYLELS